MNGKGRITDTPNRRLRWVLAFQILWLIGVCALGAWWAKLVLRQAAQIAELSGMQGALLRTQRMVFWESGTYFLLVLTSTIALFWFYWRDQVRTRGLQAFFASLTHELRTPLTSIRLQAESIAENLATSDAPGTPTSNAPQAHLIERLLEDTLRLEGQVERTLELARIEGGGPIYTQPLQIGPLLDRTVRSWRETYGERVRFTVDPGASGELIEADASSVQVILRNLLENALRHSRKSPAEIRISSERQGDVISLRFSDDGQGFQGDPRVLGRLFQKGPQSQGAGVGLYLVRVLMERMGGFAQFVLKHGERGFTVALHFKVATLSTAGGARD